MYYVIIFSPVLASRDDISGNTNTSINVSSGFIYIFPGQVNWLYDGRVTPRELERIRPRNEVHQQQIGEKKKEKLKLTW